MKKFDLYKYFLLSDLDVDSYSPMARKLIVLNILLIISISVLSFFSIYNLFFTNAYYLGLIDTVALIGAMYAFSDIRVTKNIAKASFIATSNIFFIMCAVVYFMQGENFTLVWTLFIPIFSIFIHGSKQGLLMTIVIYAIIFVMAFIGIGEWQNGTWNNDSFVRLIVSNVALTLIIFFFEKSLEDAYQALQKNRITQKNYIEGLEYTSVTDPLTKLYNRRYLDVQFKDKFNKAKANKSLFAIFLLDLDYFKDFNDTYGHIEGDKALQSVAGVLTEGMKRESDSVFRIGGEEFCGLLIADQQDKIINSLENIRQLLMNVNIAHSKSKYNILTGSFGVCIIDSFEIKDFNAMYKIADDALYLAKKNGRNCIVGADTISAL